MGGEEEDRRERTPSIHFLTFSPASSATVLSSSARLSSRIGIFV